MKIYKLLITKNLADTCRDPDEIVTILEKYFSNFENAKNYVMQYKKKIFFSK